MSNAPKTATVPPPPVPNAPPPQRPAKVLLIGALLAVVLVVGLLLQRRSRTIELRIATGQKGGTFLPLGVELSKDVEREHRNYKMLPLESKGSPFSIDMLEKKECELALVSNNSKGQEFEGEHVRLIAPLYPETLQIVVRAGANIASPLDLANKKVAIGPAASGTETIAWQVLEHFGIGKNRVQAVNMSPLDAAEKLAAGELDAVFVVAGLRAPVVERMLARPENQLLSLGPPDKVGGPIDGIHVDAPYLLQSVIPERTYGEKPAEPVGTVGVRALLVTREDIDEEVVFEITEALFQNKLHLAQKEKLLAQLTEKFDPADAPYPVHPGADRYLRRNEPSLVEKNVDLISLFLALGGIGWSGVTAIHAWRKNSQKGRIELYFANLAELTKRAREATTIPELEELLHALNETEGKALSELASERLEANDAFRVLQEGLRTIEEDLLRQRNEIRARRSA
ncbi:MAG: TAXI family TRAP transporter solute-binding subunit [Labilithrix sp.]